MSEKVRVRATVRGRVQMVGFRAFVLEHGAGLHGTVANRPDGTVECVAEGQRQQVDRLVDLLRRGPTHARVEAVEVQLEPARGDLPPMTMTS
jgi:acylphosphatase